MDCVRGNLLKLYHKMNSIQLEKLLRRKAVSFDIFDTLVVRKCGKPYNLFEIVERKFNKEHNTSSVHFKNIRIESEIEARKKKKTGEISLQDIYDIASERWGIENSSVLMELEKETEMEQCTANKEIVDIYHKLITNIDVYIVSDMYFKYEFIIKILESCKIELPKKLYVSAEYNASKRDRKLFRFLLEENGIHPHNITHIGDNFRSDYINPKLLGMHSIWIK